MLVLKEALRVFLANLHSHKSSIILQAESSWIDNWRGEIACPLFLAFFLPISNLIILIEAQECDHGRARGTVTVTLCMN